MRPWSIGVKIGFGFLLAALLIAGAAFAARDSVQRQIAASAWVMHTYQVKEALVNLLLGLRESEAQSRLFYVTGQEGDIAFFGQAAERARAAVREVRELTRDNPVQQERLARLEARLQERLALISQRLELRRNQGMGAVVNALRANSGQALTSEIERLSHEVGEAEQSLLVGREQEQSRLNARTLTLLSWGTLGCSVGLLVLGYFIAAGVTRPVRTHSQTLSTTAVELLAAAQEQQRVMHQQSTSVHQTAASINELAASQRFVGTQSQDAAALAARSAQAAGKGRQEASQALRGLEDIRAKVASTTDQIVTLSDKARLVGRAGRLISDVTEQVNILALNAAVEAARAGEHGLGFAVVAAEVRRLADRTRTSAQEIMEMMSDVQASAQSTVVISEGTTRTVEHGTRQADSIGALFESVAEIVDESARAAERIRLACQEQQSASEQITVALAPLTAGMQQTVVAAEQVVSSARQLEEVARALRVLVG